jgi:hypothetical protein
MSKHKSEKREHVAAARSMVLATMCGMVFSGEEPEAVGAALAQTMATFLHNHKRVGDPADEDKMREAILIGWVKTVRELLELQNKIAKLEGKQ